MASKKIKEAEVTQQKLPEIEVKREDSPGRQITVINEYADMGAAVS